MHCARDFLSSSTADPIFRTGNIFSCPEKNISACIARTAREHEALMARTMMSNHTDMQDKYCGCCYDIHVLVAAGRHLCILALNRVNIVAVTTILVVHVGSGRSEHM